MAFIDHEKAVKECQRDELFKWSWLQVHPVYCSWSPSLRETLFTQAFSEGLHKHDLAWYAIH
jgi:hypothetical protein